MKHTNNFKGFSTKIECIDFLKSLGYSEMAKTELQLLGYTDGSLSFENNNLYASINKNFENFIVLY